MAGQASICRQSTGPELARALHRCGHGAPSGRFSSGTGAARREVQAGGHSGSTEVGSRRCGWCRGPGMSVVDRDAQMTASGTIGVTGGPIVPLVPPQWGDVVMLVAGKKAAVGDEAGGEGRRRRNDSEADTELERLSASWPVEIAARERDGPWSVIRASASQGAGLGLMRSSAARGQTAGPSVSDESDGKM